MNYQNTQKPQQAEGNWNWRDRSKKNNRSKINISNLSSNAVRLAILVKMNLQVQCATKICLG